jgi:hypothetical protein
LERRQSVCVCCGCGGAGEGGRCALWGSVQRCTTQMAAPRLCPALSMSSCVSSRGSLPCRTISISTHATLAHPLARLPRPPPPHTHTHTPPHHTHTHCSGPERRHRHRRHRLLRPNRALLLARHVHLGGAAGLRPLQARRDGLRPRRAGGVDAQVAAPPLCQRSVGLRLARGSAEARRARACLSFVKCKLHWLAFGPFLTHILARDAAPLCHRVKSNTHPTSGCRARASAAAAARCRAPAWRRRWWRALCASLPAWCQRRNGAWGSWVGEGQAGLRASLRDAVPVRLAYACSWQSCCITRLHTR